MIWSYGNVMNLVHVLFKWKGIYVLVGYAQVFLHLNEAQFLSIYKILGDSLQSRVDRGMTYVHLLFSH
jgi:hypothetical protein